VLLEYFSGKATAQDVAIWILAIVLSITVHEAAHAWTAYWAGDLTPKERRRLSLNPIDHLDPLGTMMLLFSHFGWGRPVEVNPANFRHPRRDGILVALCGPLSNLGLAVVFALIARGAAHAAMGKAGAGVWVVLLQVACTFVLLNLGLMMFNLLPVPPLDGSHIVAGLLPVHLAQRYERLAMPIAVLILAVLIFSGALGVIIFPVVRALYTALTGF